MTREEAIKEIKSWDFLEGKEIEAIQTLIPELAESEDERIRMALVEYFAPPVPFTAVRGMPIQKIRDWLEKQKEQKQIDYDAELEKCKHNFIYFWDKYATVKLKPAKWSEEDERILKGIIGKIDHDQTYGVSKAEMLSFLKSLRPQPKQNVNDMIITPNKEFFQWIYDRLVNVHNENPNVDYMISFKRRIEELSVDKPSWKPSEEQMKWLKDVIETVPMTCRQQVPLESLYNDLLKLM